MNEKYPQALEDLMELLRGLPGVGRRSAERMAMQFFIWEISAWKSTILHMSVGVIGENISIDQLRMLDVFQDPEN